MEPPDLTGEEALEEDAPGTTQQDQARAYMTPHLRLPLAWSPQARSILGGVPFSTGHLAFQDRLGRGKWECEGGLSPTPA